MSDYHDESHWETRRQKIMGMLELWEVVDLTHLMAELRYSKKESLIEDVKSLAKSLSAEGKVLLVEPPSCVNCGFVFDIGDRGFRIPSKCPRCKQQRISWPRIALEK